MILTIGDKYHHDANHYVEQLEIVGLDSVDEELSEGSKILPQDGESEIEVRMINNISCEYFHTTIPLNYLAESFEEGEANL